MRWRIVIWITVQATRLSGMLIRKRDIRYEFEAFSKMPSGSLGRTYYETLTAAKLTYQPNLIRHDLKHIVLGYTMEMPDELRIHAFLIGNKSYNTLAMAYLFLCLLIVPEMIISLKQDYLRGKRTPPIRKVNLNEWLFQPLSVCRAELAISPKIIIL